MNRSRKPWWLLLVLVLSFAAASFGQVAVGISVRVGPPPLPIYAQPICPGPGYFWTPGYWAWDDSEGYYWVPGTWVVAPVGMFWTPGYWGWGGGYYRWHGGYWGPHVGFYGGINYGFGYTGVGFYGGEWRGRSFYYNRSVTNVSVTNVTNVYNKTVIVNNRTTTSFNGGQGGTKMRPTPQQESFARERHVDVLPQQREHENAARQNRENFAARNHGRPVVAATARPADFSRHSVVPARASGGEYHPPAISPREARVTSNGGNGARPNEGFRPFNPPSKANSSNARSEERGNSMNRNQGRVNDRPSDDRRTNDRPSNVNRMNENRPSENRGNGRTVESRPNENRPSQNGPSQNRGNEMRPKNQPHEAPRPAPSAPRESRPAPAPRHQNAPPKDDHHRGR